MNNNVDEEPQPAAPAGSKPPTARPSVVIPTSKGLGGSGSASGSPVSGSPASAAAAAAAAAGALQSPYRLQEFNSLGTFQGRLSIETLKPKKKKGEEGEAGDSALTESVPFVVGNPAVELIEGKIHLFAERKENDDDTLPVGRGCTLLVLAVPSTMSPSEFIGFCGPSLENVKHLRVVRDAAPNRYMILVTFNNQECADEFYVHYNNKPFNLLEPELAHLGFVASMEVVSREGQVTPTAAATSSEGGVVELPVCPVCLERMDSSVANITILCQHSFHAPCLSRWGDSSCPVCRYCDNQDENANMCFECDVTQELWICLICGYVGCGRYAAAHSVQHFEEKGHAFAMEVETMRVWDYVGDGYVHRLIQSKDGAKTVELPDPSRPLDGRLTEDPSVDAMKLEAISAEFSHMLHTQLESQRMYFEFEIEHCRQQKIEREVELESLIESVLEEKATLEKTVCDTEKEKSALERRSEKLENRYQGLLKEMEEVKEMNKSLLENQSGWRERAAKAEQELEAVREEKEREVAELNEQIRDLMFFLETRDKVDASPDKAELQSGVVVTQPATPSPRRGKGKGKRRR